MLLILLAFAILWRGGRTLDTALLLGIATVCVVLARWGRRAEDRPVSSWIWWIVMAGVLWTGVSYVLTSAMNYGFDEVLETAALALLFLWMARQPEGAKIRVSVLKVLIVTVLLASLIGVLVYSLGPLNRFVGTFLDIRAPWKFAWPNAWAELCLLAWPVALLLAHPSTALGAGPQRERGQGVANAFWRIARRSTPVGVILGTLLLTFSRAAIIVILGQIVILLLWVIPRRAVWKRAALSAASTLMIGLLVFALSNHLRSRSRPVESLAAKALFLSQEGTSSLTERRAFWRQAVALVSERPLTGFGPGSFRFVQTKMMDAPLATSDHPHSVFLKLACERGVPAVFLFLALLLVVLLPFLKGLLPAGSSGLCRCPILRPLSTVPRAEMTIERVLLLTAVFGVLAHNLVDYNLQFVSISLPFVLILGMLAPKTDGLLSNKKFIRIIELVVVVAMIGAIAHEGYYAVTSTLARRREARGDAVAALKWARWSQGEWYSRDLPLERSRLALKVGAKEEAIRSARQYVASINSEDARGWKLLGETALAAREQTPALGALERAYVLGRMTDLGITQLLVETLLKRGGPAALAPRKAEIDLLLRQYYDAILRNAHYIALSENSEEFLALSSLLIESFPADEPRYQVMAAGVARQAKAERLRAAELAP